MREIREEVDLLVAGGGTAGHIAAISAARCDVSVSVIEAGTMLGGTMTEGGVFMPNHFHSGERQVVAGIPWELYQQSRAIEGVPIKPPQARRAVDTPGYYSHINVPIYASVAEQKALEAQVRLHYGQFVAEASYDGSHWQVTSYGRGIIRHTRAKEVIDATGDADLVRCAGLEVEKAPKRQPGSLQYMIEGIDMQQVWKGEVQQLYEEAMASGRLKKGDWAYFDTYPFLWLLQSGGHNSTHIYGCDTSDAEGQSRATIAGRAAMMRVFTFIKEEIPGAERAVLKTMYARALSREGFRIIGEHRVTEQEFMDACQYEDSICNAFNYIDLHNEETGCDEIYHRDKTLIPKVPFGALIPKDSERILAIGRILSSERKALAGLRAQCTCMAMGQAAGAAAALAIKAGKSSKEIEAGKIVELTIKMGAAPV